MVAACEQSDVWAQLHSAAATQPGVMSQRAGHPPPAPPLPSSPHHLHQQDYYHHVAATSTFNLSFIRGEVVGGANSLELNLVELYFPIVP